MNCPSDCHEKEGIVYFICLTLFFVEKLYGNVSSVDERHRHRYEVNPQYVEQIEAAGLRFVGKDY